MTRALRIEEWQWDDGNLEELAVHGLSPHIVEQVAEENPRFRRNKRSRAATYQMIGPDAGGAVWAVCVTEIVTQPSLWRAITGWRARDREIKWYRNAIAGKL